LPTAFGDFFVSLFDVFSSLGLCHRFFTSILSNLRPASWPAAGFRQRKVVFDLLLIESSHDFCHLFRYLVLDFLRGLRRLTSDFELSRPSVTFCPS